MMLLTASHISFGISFFVVFICTFALFLSGYILQQQTVRSIQAVIRPQLPAQKASRDHGVASSPSAEKVFVNPQESKSQSSIHPETQWSTLAYAQMVTSQRDLCGAVMLFADLAEQGSKADRVLVYPKYWNEEEKGKTQAKVVPPGNKRPQQQIVKKEKREVDSTAERQLATTRRLLRIAAKRFDVFLYPVSPLRGKDERNPSSYNAPAPLMSLTRYDRIVSIPPPGLLLDSSPLDQLLSGVETQQEAASIPLDQSAILSFKPSNDRYNELLTAHDKDQANGQQPPAIEKRFPQMQDQTLTRFLSSSRLPENNTKSIFSEASFVHIASSSSEPSPEYDIPSSIFALMGPSKDEIERRGVWESIYDRYRDARMSVCGLDLEPWNS